MNTTHNTKTKRLISALGVAVATPALLFAGAGTAHGSDFTDILECAGATAAAIALCPAGGPINPACVAATAVAAGVCAGKFGDDLEDAWDGGLTPEMIPPEPELPYEEEIEVPYQITAPDTLDPRAMDPSS